MCVSCCLCGCYAHAAPSTHAILLALMCLFIKLLHRPCREGHQVERGQVDSRPPNSNTHTHVSHAVCVAATQVLLLRASSGTQPSGFTASQHKHPNTHTLMLSVWLPRTCCTSSTHDNTCTHVPVCVPVYVAATQALL